MSSALVYLLVYLIVFHSWRRSVLDALIAASTAALRPAPSGVPRFGSLSPYLGHMLAVAANSRASLVCDFALLFGIHGSEAAFAASLSSTLTAPIIALAIALVVAART